MPPAFTVPLIGSSFDALNAQRFAWTNRNDQVESANIARFNAAQENQNRYRFNVAQAQQEAMLRDAQSRDAAARDSINLALGERASWEDSRRFDLGLKQRGDELKVQERRYQFSVDREKRKLDEENKTVENFADEFRKPLFQVGKKRDGSEAEYLKAQQEFAQQEQALQALPSEKELQALLIGSPERVQLTKAVADAKAAYAKAQGQLAIAEEKFALSDREFTGLAKNAQDFGLSVKRDGDKYAFFRPRDRRTFGMHPDELVPQASVGPAVRVPQAAPVVTPSVTPAFVPQTAITSSRADWGPLRLQREKELADKMDYTRKEDGWRHFRKSEYPADNFTQPEPIAPRSMESSKLITATNPRTGEKIVYVNGKWQPLK